MDDKEQLKKMKKIVEAFKKLGVSCRKKRKENEYVCIYNGKEQNITATVGYSNFEERPYIAVHLPSEEISEINVDEGQLGDILTILGAEGEIEYSFTGGLEPKPVVILYDPEKAVKIMKAFGDEDLYVDVGEKRGVFYIKRGWHTLTKEELDKIFKNTNSNI